MTQTYFLGANSTEGFASLYRFFPGAEDAFLHIVKGGPGTGKSSFMRRIGAAAEARGLDVHYVLCSGDPASLDGVFIPTLHLAWVDGTAPHVSEPICFGVDSDYVNLGMFCRTPFDSETSEKLKELLRRHKRLYAEAYRELKHVQRLENIALDAPELLRLPVGRACPCLPEQRFLHAFSCEGELFLWSEIKKLCKHIGSVSPASLQALSRELEQHDLPAVRCPSPLDPGELEALLIPWADRALVAGLAFRGLEPALDKLREAKSLHDEMEDLVRPYMDFAALTDYTEATLRELFG
ncbi:MAG: hypothetical protein IKO83_01250 [Oscillospiraceae bacterium]|nr:hypothetical protein [Oscillospiraceae bacterium]